MGQFERIFQLKATSFRLIALFVLSYAFISLLLSVTVTAGIFFFSPKQANPHYFGYFLLIFTASMFFVFGMVYSKYHALKVGVPSVMEMLGAVRVHGLQHNELLRRFHQVAEEVALAANLKTPKTYLINSMDINALAVASSEEDVGIAVTEGAITRLSREELRALVGHEMSHILHKDCLLNFKLVIWLYGLQCVYLYGRDLFHSITDIYPFRLDRLCLGYAPEFQKGKSAGSLSIGYFPLFFISMIVLWIGSMGAIIARLLKSAISRKREFLADAESVRLTRSDAIVDVLKKIAFLEVDDESLAMRSESVYHEFSHFYLTDYQDLETPGRFDTHPPIIARIRAIDPEFELPTDAELIAMNRYYYHDFSEESDELVSAHGRYANTKLHGRKRSRGFDALLGKPIEYDRLQGGVIAVYQLFLSDQRLIVKAQLEYLKGALPATLFDELSQTLDEVMALSAFDKAVLLIKSVDPIRELHEADREAFDAKLKVLRRLNRRHSRLSVAMACYLDEMLHRIDVDRHEDGLVFELNEKTLFDEKSAVLFFFEMLLGSGKPHTFSTRFLMELAESLSLENHPATPLESPNQEALKTFSEMISFFSTLNLANRNQLSTWFDEIYRHEVATSETRALIYLISLTAKLTLPMALRLKNEPDQKPVSRLNFMS
ncbi:M48 family metalloprotease [Ignatzschineria sp. RMDPL8A]|uniref:M48 family metalloprotease n=1 Tax=Ignatzschineria sp. RMDPL8A TaxID=2999236 RepID=UPI002446783F|nr:M48 family metalloprotease [Ignatzschineria sp. RMDPL8A]MDG9730211.1 M48 family metalloprotease [Ignatzschineria sp. RMDPL8A]